jgi:hypothetical protein
VRTQGMPFRVALQHYQLVRRFPEWRIRPVSGLWLARRSGVRLIVCDTVAELIDSLARADGESR